MIKNDLSRSRNPNYTYYLLAISSHYCIMYTSSKNRPLDKRIGAWLIREKYIVDIVEIPDTIVVAVPNSKNTFLVIQIAIKLAEPKSKPSKPQNVVHANVVTVANELLTTVPPVNNSKLTKRIISE